MIAVAKPFVRILWQPGITLPRWQLFSTLARLAILKRVNSGQTQAVKLGKYMVHTPDYDVLSLLIKEKFVDEEYRFSTSSQSPVIIDCGASIGISMLYFKTLYPAAHIHCFEPNTTAFKYLSKNVAANELKNVVLHRAALSDTEGNTSLYVPGSRAMINSSLQYSDTEEIQTVPVMRLSTFLDEFTHIDLIKIDVEGEEWNIIRDLQQHGILERRVVSQFIIEYHTRSHPGGSTLQELVDLFQSYGYAVNTRALFENIPQSDVLVYAIKEI